MEFVPPAAIPPTIGSGVPGRPARSSPFQCSVCPADADAVLEMLHGKSAQAIAVANTAILMELIQELVRRGEFTKPNAIALLESAIDALKNGPNASSQRVGKAMDIIRLELVPRLRA